MMPYVGSKELSTLSHDNAICWTTSDSLQGLDGGMSGLCGLQQLAWQD